MLIFAAVLLLRAAGLFFYLCVILDLFSRKVIAYKLSLKNDSKLALGSLYGCQKTEILILRGLFFTLTAALNLLLRFFVSELECLFQTCACIVTWGLTFENR